MKKIFFSFAFFSMVFLFSGAAQSQTGNLFPHLGWYDYVPSSIREGDSLKLWWCSGSGGGDVILYREINVSTQYYGPITQVLAPTPGTWDSQHTCDPSVIMGVFVNPEDNITYSYAMYYTGTNDASNLGSNNGVGVAFSNDGVLWKKYSHPVLRKGKNAQNPDGVIDSSHPYGYGEQSVISGDGRANVWMFALEKLCSTCAQSYRLYNAVDAISFMGSNSSFENSGLITTRGVSGGFITEADFAFDSSTGNVYMTTDNLNDVSSITLYRISWGGLGSGVWTNMGSIKKSGAVYPGVNTGQNLNWGSGLLRNKYGSNTPWLPTVQVFFGSSNDAVSPGNNYLPLTWELWWGNITVN